MAEAGSVEIAISATTDGVRAGLEAVRQLLNEAGPRLGAAAAVVGAAITAGIGYSIKAYGDAERAATSLAVALRNAGDASQATLTDMLAYADGLSRTSRFTKDEIEEAQAFLATQGLTGQALKIATQAAVDLGTQTGNLTMASRLLGNAYEGSGTGLRRFGIILEEGTAKADMYAEALRQIQEKFDGRAAADAQSLAGQIDDLGKIFQQFAVHVGAELGPAVKDFVRYINENRVNIFSFADTLGGKIVDLLNKMRELANFLTTLNSTWSKLISGNIGGGIKGLITGGLGGMAEGSSLGPLGAILGAVGGAMQGGLSGMATGGLQIPPLRKGSGGSAGGMAGQVGQGAGKGSVPGLTEFEKAWDAAYAKVYGDGTTKLQVMINRIEALMNGFTSSLSSGIKQFLQGVLMDGENLGQALMHIADSLLQFFLNAIAQMLAEWIAKHIVMAAVSKLFNLDRTKDTAIAGAAQVSLNKATALAEIPAVIGITNAQIVEAYASIPFVGPILAAGAIAEADAQIAGYAALIAAAEGGIVTGPTAPMLVGEAGAEAIVPLTGSRGKAALREIGAGSGAQGQGVHIHLHGTLIEGSADKWERLTRNVIVPALERHGRKTLRTKGTSW